MSQLAGEGPDAPGIGDVVGPLRVGRIAHGGHWVARGDDGRVLFLRHGLEGELVRARITGLARRYGRADVIEVLEPSPQRIPEPCPIAGACGGCDFQHVAPAHQRELKRQVIAEQLRHLAGISWDGVVEAAPGGTLGWRRRMRYHGSGHAWGLHAARSHAVIELPASGCALASPELGHPAAAGRPARVGEELIGARTADGVVWVGRDEHRLVRERAAGRDWTVRADGFWQVHPAAPDLLVEAVLSGLEPAPGERAWDLYCGAGLFAGVLAAHGVAVTGIEADGAALTLARRNVPSARFLTGRVDRMVQRAGEADLVVLDPPRDGAGAPVMERICASGARRVAYVACDPAALARDLGLAGKLGWGARSIRAFDLFPSTHHVECVSIMEPVGSSSRS